MVEPIGVRHPLLEALDVPHQFGERGSAIPQDVVRPRQVHGIEVAVVRAGASVPAEADAITSVGDGPPVGIFTADCVPVLACSDDGLAVAAIHAGWRGLAAGVVEAAVAALRAQSRVGVELVAVIGPHIGSCCYEVDEPVLRPLSSRFGSDFEGTLLASKPHREGHYRLDLGRLATIALRRAGIDARRLGRIEDVCTRCDAARFHSFRRDGEDSGRQLHWVATRRERSASHCE